MIYVPTFLSTHLTRSPYVNSPTACLHTVLHTTSGPSAAFFTSFFSELRFGVVRWTAHSLKRVTWKGLQLGRRMMLTLAWRSHRAVQWSAWPRLICSASRSSRGAVRLAHFSAQREREMSGVIKHLFLTADAAAMGSSAAAADAAQ